MNEITYFRTSMPASPNLRAAYPMKGKADITMIGVRNLHFSGAFTLKASRVAAKA